MRGYFAIFALPIVLLASFHLINTPHLRSDSAYFLQDSFDAYWNLRSQGLRAFVEIPSSFHKPLLLGLTGGLSLLATGRDLKAMLLLHNTAAFAVLLAYLFCLLSRLGVPRARAALGACVLSLMPWLFNVFCMFEAELLYLPAMLAATYHLLSSRQLSRLEHGVAFAGWGLVALTARPVETAMYLGVPFLTLLLVGQRRHGRRSARALVALLVALFLAVIWFYPAREELLLWVSNPVGGQQPIGPWTVNVDDRFRQVVTDYLLGFTAKALLAALVILVGLRAFDWRFLRAGKAEMLACAWICFGPPLALTIAGRVYSPHYFAASPLLLLALLAAAALQPIKYRRPSHGFFVGAVIAVAFGATLIKNVLLIGYGNFSFVVLEPLVAKERGFMFTMEKLVRDESAYSKFEKQVAAVIDAEKAAGVALVGTAMFKGFGFDKEQLGFPQELNNVALAEKQRLYFISIGGGFKFLPYSKFWVPEELACLSYLVIGPRPVVRQDYDIFTHPTAKRMLSEWLDAGFRGRRFTYLTSLTYPSEVSLASAHPKVYDLYRNNDVQPRSCLYLWRQARRLNALINGR